MTTLTATQGYSNYVWLPNISSTLNSIVVTPQTTSIYQVQVTDNNGCKNQASTIVSVIERAANLPVPNIFSPNNDGANDCFEVKYWGSVTNYELNIYNRWGQKIFYTNQLNKCWDGTYNGKYQPNDTYVYYIKAFDACIGKPFMKKGTVVLVR